MKVKMCQHIIQNMILLIRFLLGWWFSWGAYSLHYCISPQLIEWTKFEHWWVCLIIGGLIQADITEVGILRFRIPVYCRFTYVYSLMSSLLLFVVDTWRFQTRTMKKEKHHSSGLGIVLVGHQIFLGDILFWM